MRIQGLFVFTLSKSLCNNKSEPVSESLFVLTPSYPLSILSNNKLIKKIDKYTIFYTNQKTLRSF